MVLVHPLTNISITKYFKYKPRFACVYSGNTLPKMKDVAYVIYFDDKQIKETDWVSLFVDKNAAVYFHSFRIEFIPKEVSMITKDKSTNHTQYI